MKVRIRVHLPLITVAIVSLLRTCKAEQEVTRTTSLGGITGLRTLVPGTTDSYVDQFRKIPYALPPVGNLRFQKPQPFGRWEGTFNGKEFGPSCVQGHSEFFIDVPNKELSEDCLFLNIYVPSNASPNDNLPVMVWIHGGAFLYGQGMFYNASNLAAVGNVVVVTINYRLGLFGFLALNDPVAQGNYGIHDQILALQWVQDNIVSFGGDPNSVTIFGESAGGMSTSLLSLIPSNKGLFHRVISQSGSSNSPCLMVDTSYFLSELVETSAGCANSGDDKQSFLDCMRDIPAETLQHIVESIYASSDDVRFILGFGPVVDGELFPDQPNRLLSDSYPNHHYFFRSLDLLTGATSGEGSLLFIQLSNPKLQTRYMYDVSKGLSKDVLCNLVATSLARDYFQNNQKIAKMICDEYSVDLSEGIQAQSIRTTDAHGEFFLTTPVIEIANLHSERNGMSNTFVYMHSRINPVHIGPASPSWFTKSVHADELFYLFGIQQYPNIDQKDLDFSNTLMTYWANFARYGNVNKERDKSVPTWPLYSVEHQLYNDFGTDIKVRLSPARRAHQFWFTDIPKASHSENHSHDPGEL